MLQSLGTHLAHERRGHVHILADGLSLDDQSRVVRSAPPTFTLRWHQAPPLPRHLPLWGPMSATTYQKLNLAHWLPPDVAVLWDESLTGLIALAVPDERVPLVSSRFGVAGWRELHLPRDAPHFNAGLLMVDLAREPEFAGAWALAAPSRWAEPLGLVAIEAIIRGRPAIVPSTGGLAGIALQDNPAGTSPRRRSIPCRLPSPPTWIAYAVTFARFGAIGGPAARLSPLAASPGRLG